MRRWDRAPLGQRIFWLRLDAGLTQLELADRAGVPRKTVVLWELLERKPSGEHMLQLARSLTAPGRPSLQVLRCLAWSQDPGPIPKTKK